MSPSRKSLLCFALSPVLAAVVGCSGADAPKIPDVAPPPAPTPAETTGNMPKNKYMENDRYKEGMRKMQEAQGGK